MAKKIDPSVTHPEYAELARKYDLCDDAFRGDVCEYVAKLKGQTDQKFQEYVARAAYFGVVERTVQAIIGMMMRKPFELVGMTEFPVTDHNTPDAFLQELIRDLLLGARVAILVDVDAATGKSKLVTYDADDIINWSGKFVMIKECSLVEDSDNPYAHVLQESWRELYYDDNGNYAARVWTKNRRGQFVAEDVDQFMVNGSPVKQIPLFVVTPYDNTWDIYTPPLFVQSGLNIQHFKQAVDLAHYGRHMALPTFTISGELAQYEDGSKAEVCLGSTEQALHLTQGSNAQYVEVSGASFGMLQTELGKVEDRMFLSGGRLLTHKNGVETIAAMRLRSGAETAVLETITNSLEAALNGALEICGQIDRLGSIPEINLNNDFTATVDDPQMIQALLAAYVAGTISLEQFQARLIDGELIGEHVAAKSEDDANSEDEEAEEDDKSVTVIEPSEAR